MTENDAEEILGILVGATTGWRDAADETFCFYIKQIRLMRDRDAALEAVEELGRTWDEPRRPSVAALNDAYRRILLRRSEAMAELPPASVPPLERGRKIAHDAYLAECKRAGREPRPEVVDSLLAAIGASS